jgi:hypothetical protein
MEVVDSVLLERLVICPTGSLSCSTLCRRLEVRPINDGKGFITLSMVSFGEGLHDPVAISSKGFVY